jgi:hypothetical protein
MATEKPLDTGDQGRNNKHLRNTSMKEEQGVRSYKLNGKTYSSTEVNELLLVSKQEERLAILKELFHSTT